MTSSINKGNNRYPVFHRVINNLLALLTVLDARVSGPGRKVANFCKFKLLINKQGIQI